MTANMSLDCHLVVPGVVVTVIMSLVKPLYRLRRVARDFDHLSNTTEIVITNQLYAAEPLHPAVLPCVLPDGMKLHVHGRPWPSSRHRSRRGGQDRFRSTTRRLAAEIEYSQPVLYSHFSGKDAIMAAAAVEASPSSPLSCTQPVRRRPARGRLLRTSGRRTPGSPSNGPHCTKRCSLAPSTCRSPPPKHRPLCARLSPDRSALSPGDSSPDRVWG